MAGTSAATQRRGHLQRHAIYRARLDALKAGPCQDCGDSFPPECMDFDHRPGEVKLFSVGRASTRSWLAVLAEIAKCDLICANCHRIRTVARMREEVA